VFISFGSIEGARSFARIRSPKPPQISRDYNMSFRCCQVASQWKGGNPPLTTFEPQSLSVVFAWEIEKSKLENSSQDEIVASAQRL